MKGIRLFIKGAVIGVAAIIPGVSGSVFAVITGVYDDIIFFAGRITRDFLKSFLFLLPIGIGALLGVMLAANPVLEICERYPLYSYCFFVGVMLASLLPTLKKVKSFGKPKVAEYFVAPLCFALVILLRLIAAKTNAGSFVSIPELRNIGDFAALFFSGFISVGLMSLPGVSGSVILLVIGQYGTVYKAAGSPARLLKAALEGESSSFFAALGSSALLIPFFIGAILGMGVATRLISHLLKKHSKRVYLAVLGLVSASVVTLCADCLVPAVRDYSGNGFLLALTTLAFVLSGGLLTLCFSGDKSTPDGEK